MAETIFDAVAGSVNGRFDVVDQTFTNVGITTRSGSGAYWVSVDTSLPENAEIISVNSVQWGSAAANFSTNISGTRRLEFVSDISQTVGSITVRMLVRYT